MIDVYKDTRLEASDPIRQAVLLTPHDTNNLASVSKALYVGGTGNLVCILANDTASVTFLGIPAGTILPFMVKRVLDTSTTATNIIALY